MSEQMAANALLALSRQLEHLVEVAASAVVGIQSHGRSVASGLIWRPGTVVTASDAFEADDDISVMIAGKSLAAQIVGRDPTFQQQSPATSPRHPISVRHTSYKIRDLTPQYS